MTRVGVVSTCFLPSPPEPGVALSLLFQPARPRVMERLARTSYYLKSVPTEMSMREADLRGSRPFRAAKQAAKHKERTKGPSASALFAS
jgi:hypothetical protein